MSELQRTSEWFAARCGKITASRIHDLAAKRRDGAASASRTNYIAELVAERLTGVPAERYTNAAMQRGTEVEPEALAAYEIRTNYDVIPTGFVAHHSIANAGASPDGLVNDDGLVEIKCPNTATHLATLRGSPIAAEYIDQMQWQMACTGRQWCDFVSYDPRLPQSMALFVRRVARDDARITELEALVIEANAEVAAAVADLRKRYEPAPQQASDLHPLMAG